MTGNQNQTYYEEGANNGVEPEILDSVHRAQNIAYQPVQLSFIERMIGKGGYLDVPKITEAIEKFAKIIDNYKIIAVQRTQKSDWVALEDTPYLKHTGVGRVARHMGVNFKQVDQWREVRKDSKGEYYIYFSKYLAAHPILGSAEGMGGASSRKKFFAKRGGEWRADEDIDEINIANSADTNGKARAFNNLFEMRNLDWEVLEKYHPGICGMLNVKFKKDNESSAGTGKKGEANTNQQDAKGNSSKKDPREIIWNRLLELNNGDEKEAANTLETMTTFQNEKGDTIKGKRNPMDLTPSWAWRVINDNQDVFKKNGNLFS